MWNLLISILPAIIDTFKKKKQDVETPSVTPTPVIYTPFPVKQYRDTLEFIPSPNFNSRPVGKNIKCIVLHHTAGSIESTISWFKSTESGVSAHYVIGKDGRIVQMVQDEDRAWHAGASTWKGETDINSISIGIEMEGDGVIPFTDEQYEATAELVKYLKYTYGIEDDWIVCHKDVAIPKGRKTDPSPFDADRFFKLVNN